MKNNKRLLARSLMEICEKKPLDYVTVTEITKTAGLTRQVFYHHFADKYELAKWVHMSDYIAHIENMEIDSLTTMHFMEVVFEWLKCIERHKKFYNNAYHSVEGKEFQRLIKMHIFDSYKYIIEKNENHKISQSMLFSLQIFTVGASEKMFEWIKEEMPISANLFCKYLFEAMPAEIQKAVVSYKITKQELIYLTKMVIKNSEANNKGYMS